MHINTCILQPAYLLISSTNTASRVVSGCQFWRWKCPIVLWFFCSPCWTDVEWYILKPIELSGTVRTSNQCLRCKKAATIFSLLCQNFCRQKLNPWPLTNQNYVRWPHKKNVMSCSSANVQPVNRAVPLNSLTDILKNWWSFTGSNVSSCSWIIKLMLAFHLFIMPRYRKRWIVFCV